MSHELRIEVSASHNPDAAPDANGQYPVAFIRKQLKAAEVYPEDQRYNAGTGKVQWSPDGGVTWEDAPQFDPRRTANGPPPTGANLKCDGAASVKAFIKRFFDQTLGILIAGGTAATAAAGVLAVLVELGPFAILIAILTGVLDAFAVAGANVIKAQLTDSVYDELECIIFCAIGNDGVCSPSELAAIQTAVTANIGGVAATAINLVLSLMGEGGVSTAAGKKYATGDCSGCTACAWCAEWDLTAEAGPFEVQTDQQGVYVPGTGWFYTDSNQTGQYRRGMRLQIPLLTGIHTLTVAITEVFVAGSHASGLSNGDIIADNGTILTNNANPASGTYVRSYNTGRTWAAFQCQSFCSAQTSASYSGSTKYTHLKITGDGPNPFDRNNC